MLAGNVFKGLLAQRRLNPPRKYLIYLPSYCILLEFEV